MTAVGWLCHHMMWRRTFSRDAAVAAARFKYIRLDFKRCHVLAELNHCADSEQMPYVTHWWMCSAVRPGLHWRHRSSTTVLKLRFLSATRLALLPP